MTYKIGDACIACGACVDTCSSAAIVESADKYTIKPEQCTDCGACTSNCPVEAIAQG